MTDDFFDPQKPEQNCHSADSFEQEKKYFCSPPNLGDVVWRLPELWTDPSSNQLSASRFVLFWVGIWVCVIALYETFEGHTGTITTMIAAVFASCAGVYFGSTVKDWRWRRRDRDD